MGHYLLSQGASGPTLPANALGIVPNDATQNAHNTAIILQTVQSFAPSAISKGGGTLQFGIGDYYYDGVQLEQLPGVQLRGVSSTGTRLVGSATCAIGLDLHSAAGSGIGNHNQVISDMTVSMHNATAQAIAIRVWNGLHFTLERLEVEGKGCAMSIQGTGNGAIRDCDMWISNQPNPFAGVLWIGSGNTVPTCRGGTNDGLLTSSGPLVVENCQITSYAGVNAPPRIVEAGHGVSGVGGTGTFATSFHNCTVNSEGGNMDGTTVVDGITTTVAFHQEHTESNWPGTSIGADFVIGKYSKPESVLIPGYDANGNGNSANAPAAGSGTFSATANTTGVGTSVTTNPGTMQGTPAAGMAILHSSNIPNSGGFDWPTRIGNPVDNGDGTWTLPLLDQAGNPKALNGGGAANTTIIGNLRFPWAIQVYSCKSLIVEGGYYPAYLGALARFEAGYPAAGDYVSICANPVVGGGSSAGLMVLDADGKITPGPRQPQRTGQWHYEHRDTSAPPDSANIDPQPGVMNIAPSIPPGVTAVAGVANHARLSRTVTRRSILLTSVAFAIRSPATNDDNIDVGLFDPAVSTTVPIWHSGLVNSASGKIKDLTGAATGVASNGVKIINLSDGVFMAGYAGAFLLVQPGRVYYDGVLYSTQGGAAAPQFDSWNWQDPYPAELFGAVQPNVAALDVTSTAGGDLTTVNLAGAAVPSTAVMLALREI